MQLPHLGTANLGVFGDGQEEEAEGVATSVVGILNHNPETN